MLERILDKVGDELKLIKADGFDEAVIGLSNDDRLVYSVSKIVGILIKDDVMSHEEAIEHFEFNIVGAYVGIKTPVYVYDGF